MRRFVLALAVLGAATCVADPAHAQKPSAERPSYAVGDTWILNGVTYTVSRVDGSGYVFVGDDRNEISLTKDLTVSRVVRDGRAVYAISGTLAWPWPLASGKFTTSRIVFNDFPEGVVAHSGGAGGAFNGDAQMAATVESYEDVTVPAGRFKAFKITEEMRGSDLAWSRTFWRTTLWYAPELKRIVKSESVAVAMNFEVTAVPAHGPAPVVASAPGPPRPDPAPAPPAAVAAKPPPPALAQKPSAERPAYVVGDTWILNGVTYTVSRVDGSGYVFVADGRNDISLTKDLTVSRVVRDGRNVYTISGTPAWPWPLARGQFTVRRVIVKELPQGVTTLSGASASPHTADVQMTVAVEAYEEVTVPAGRFAAFKITEEFRGPDLTRSVLIWRTTLWYAPELRRIVKSESIVGAMNFEVTAVPGRELAPAVASVPAPVRPAPAPVVPPPVAAKSPTPAPPVVSRAPPAITLLDPKPSTLLRSAEVTLKIEVKSDNRMKALVVKGRDADKTFVPEPRVKAAEPWIIETKVSLAEGGNTVRLEALDEHGGRAAETIHLIRQSLVAVQFEGPADARLRVEQDQHTLDGNGRLTLHLAPGRYQVEATKDGFAPFRHALHIPPGQGKIGQKLALLPLVPPTLTVLAPAPGAVLAGADTKLKIEAKSRYRLTAIRLGKDKESMQQTFAPPAGAKAGESWVLEPLVLLGEGDNTFRIEAVDEHGTRAERTLTVTRRTAVAAAPLPAPEPADNEPPAIAINYPGIDARVEAESIVIVGLATDNVAVDRLQIAVNGVQVAQPRDLVVVGRGVPIRVPAALQPGANVIEIVAADRMGNVSQIVRTVTRIAPAVVRPAPKVASRWAVVIGISEYEHRGIPALRFAARDAEAIYQFLTTRGGYPKEHVILLTDMTAQKPTLLNIKRALGDFLARRAGRDDMVLIYFAGHGAPEVDTAGNEADGLSKYLIPRDGDPDSLYTTALPMDDLQRIFARIAADRIVMLLDTCYSGAAGGRTFARASTRASGLNDQFLERLTRSRGRVIMTASGPNEVALELPALGHGVFTYYVLEGLRGKADRNNDGIVTMSELYEYVEDHVDGAARRAGGRQRPLMKGEIEGTLPLSKTR